MSQGKQHEAGASEGARRATGEASALSALVGTGRWSARRKVSVVIEWLKGESLEGLSRRHGVTAAKLSQWRGEFLAGGEAHLKHRETPIEDEDTRRLKSVVGGSRHGQGAPGREDSASGGRPPFGLVEVEAMSRETSPSTQQPYGIARVTRVWQVPRSTCMPGEIDGITPRPRRSAGRRRRGPMRC